MAAPCIEYISEQLTELRLLSVRVLTVSCNMFLLCLPSVAFLVCLLNGSLVNGAVNLLHDHMMLTVMEVLTLTVQFHSQY